MINICYYYYYYQYYYYTYTSTNTTILFILLFLLLTNAPISTTTTIFLLLLTTTTIVTQTTATTAYCYCYYLSQICYRTSVDITNAKVFSLLNSLLTSYLIISKISLLSRPFHHVTCIRCVYRCIRFFSTVHTNQRFTNLKDIDSRLW